MRVLTLREQNRQQVNLTPEEVRQLLDVAPRAVQLTPAGGDAYDLATGSVVGTIALPSLRLVITPKVSLPNVFFLLAYGAGLTRWTPPHFPYAHEPDFLKAIAWLFEAEVTRALVHGLARGYEPRAETLPTLRGRLDIARQLRVRPGQSFPLDCHFEEYTEDITLNRVLRAAHERLLSVPNLDPAAARRLWATRRAFAEVAAVRYSPADVPALRFNRLTQHWEAAALLARLILQQRTLRDRAGAISAITFTVDMNALFERFLERVIAAAAAASGWDFRPQPHRHLTPDVPIRPDFILRRAGRDRIVADAKYKLPEDRWDQSDLYQLLAYCAALGLPSGLLIYATSQSLERQTVNRLGVHLDVTGIDLTQAPAQVLAQSQSVAAYLMHAAQTTSASTAA